jgi:hypothetical protein
MSASQNPNLAATPQATRRPRVRLRGSGAALVLGMGLSLSLAGCGGAVLDDLDGEGEDLGPYAERMPWAEYMATAAMDTVQGAMESSACTTASIRGLSDQIVAEMNCIRPGLMSNITGSNVSLTSAAALPYLQNPAAAALKRATTGRSRLGLNSTLRTVAQQWMLYSWYRSGRCGVGLAALPGRSNHEDGLAIDTSDYASWRSILAGQGFRWFGSGDAVHFDYTGGADAQGVLAFQRLWNHNNPGDKIAADGVYGPATDARIRKSPRTGFAKGASCK